MRWLWSVLKWVAVAVLVGLVCGLLGVDPPTACWLIHDEDEDE